MVQTKRSKPGEGKGGLPAKVDPLGPTVLLAGEDQASYDRLAAQITAAVGPEDIIEAIWCAISWISFGRPCGCGA